MKLRFVFDEKYIEISEIPEENLLRFQSDQLIRFNNNVVINMRNVKYIEILEK